MTVGVVAEYNPFHLGHAYHIRKIREAFGNDTRIIAVMSGHYTARGDVAIADKYTRAAAAILGGVNLVLELPFPFSGEHAAVFARSAVHILRQFEVDVISFGSECGEIPPLQNAARLSGNQTYAEALRTAEKHNKDGFPKTADSFFRQSFGAGGSVPFRSPNDLLGMEYIKAAEALDFSVVFHTVKRNGDPHDTESVSSGVPSAAAIRKLFLTGQTEKAMTFLPESTRSLYRTVAGYGLFPSRPERLDAPVLSYFCINSPSDAAIADAGGGLSERLFRKAVEASGIDHLVTLTATKKYTKSRIRRAIRNIVFGVTSSDIQALPGYTQILAFDAIGQAILKERKPRDDFSVLTKPSDLSSLSPVAKRQKKMADIADALYTLCLPKPAERDLFLRCSPFRKSANPDENFFPSSFVEGIDKNSGKEVSCGQKPYLPSTPKRKENSIV